ncbi:MAG: hypothetical protein ACFFD4_35350, partial [Candidatus Odinarchaeota archaeon]
MELLFVYMGFIISFLIALYVTPKVHQHCFSRNILITVDAHKPGSKKPEIAEPGGIAPLLSFTFSILIVLFIKSVLKGDQGQDYIVSITLLGGVLSVVIAGLIGLVDDVFHIKWRYKIALGFLPALPLMVLRVGTPEVN